VRADACERAGSITREQFTEWLRHPVTKAIGLVIVAEIVYTLVLKHGARLLGLGEVSE